MKYCFVLHCIAILNSTMRIFPMCRSTRYNTLFFIVKVNTDQCRDVAGDHDIPGGEQYPTFVRYSGGRKGTYYTLYKDETLDGIRGSSMGMF